MKTFIFRNGQWQVGTFNTSGEWTREQIVNSVTEASEILSRHYCGAAGRKGGLTSGPAKARTREQAQKAAAASAKVRRANALAKASSPSAVPASQTTG